jgi:3-oxoacyl-[acyl-carrier protein] reductase
MTGDPSRPVALVTGASRREGIGAAIAVRLANSGWNVARTYWLAYDRRMPWGTQPEAIADLDRELRARGAATAAVEADLAELGAAARIFDNVESRLGAVSALVLAHAESVDSSILDTTVESFDRHFAVNARATWLIVREFASRFGDGRPEGGRIIGLTSDHVAGNVPYGASKGALDRIVLAAAPRVRPPGHPRQCDQPWPNRHRLDDPGATARVRPS